MMNHASTLDETEATPTIAVVSAAMEDQADSLKGAAARCDSLCLSVGAQLIEAVPGLNELSARFAGLSETLGGDDLAEACGSLDAVAREVESIGDQMARERQSLCVLIGLNAALSQLIVGIADDIRFLSAMIPVVKVESVSIDDDTEGLQNFGLILEDLASKARTTIGRYRSTHGKLLRQLDEAQTIQADFESSSQAGLGAVVKGIDESLEAVAERRRSVAAKITGVATCTQQIGMQIAEGVVALQIGDTIRQRIEHANEAMLMLAAGAATGNGPDLSLGIVMSDAETWFAIHRLCQLASLQVTDAGDEFKTGIETIVSLLSNVVEATADIMRMGNDLVSADGDGSSSFLDGLEARLKTAWVLIDDYARSRATIDGVTASVATAFADLEQLGANVAALVTDMTIIGTNAIIKSYRLGLRGAGLSVIAQHLRIHALKIAAGIKLLTPALAAVLEAAKTFTDSLEESKTTRMQALGERTTHVLGVFKASGAQLTTAIGQLKSETAAVDATLRVALATLTDIDEIDACLRAASGHFDSTADSINGLAEPSDHVDEALHGLLRPRYTMQSERQMHDTFFNRR